MKKILILLLVSLLTFSCSSNKEKKSKPTVKTAYLKAKRMLDKKDYLGAGEAFEKLNDDFPFSPWSTKGQIMAIYSYYKYEDLEKTTTLIDDFIRLNPNNDNIPYCLYIKGLIYYNKIPDITRAQDDTKIASTTFRELIARFPQTKYSKDAKAKLPFIDEHIVGAKMALGRRNIKLKNYVGAVEYFLEVTNRYRRSNQLPEAYFRLNEIYHKIGLKSEAQKALDQLQINFPNNYWTTLVQEK